jgi:DNA repair protein RadD
VKTLVYAPASGGPDLRGVRTRQGDYVERELAARVDRPELVGDIVTHWHRHADRRKTVVFATSVAHSIHLKDEFCKSGVKAEHIDGKTPKDERDEILARLERGEIDVICNCMVLTEGWDMPPVSCCVLARPTKSMGLYRQMAGRVIRPADGKTNAIILDHAGAVFMHGFIEDSVVWTLDPDLKAETPVHASRSILRASNLLACTQCEAIRNAGKACPGCGFLPKRPGEHLAVIDGDLQRLDRDGARGAGMSNEDRHRWHRELVGLAQERDYKPGWAGYKYKEKFGTWPMQRYVEPLAPSPEVRAWVRSRQIAYAKSMQKAQAAYA